MYEKEGVQMEEKIEKVILKTFLSTFVKSTWAKVDFENQLNQQNQRKCV